METTKVNQHLIGMIYDDIIPKLDFIQNEGGCCGYADYDLLSELLKLVIAPKVWLLEYTARLLRSI